ncbi:MAG: low specificity L-threonine aldolase [Spirochaetales bacterium]|nr:low specificity L-threonine aldolase [Spirochaetales bacterium]
MSERFFASDNSATVHPAIMEALSEANRGHAIAYGEDEWTEKANRVFRDLFGRRAEVFFVYNGTGANVIGMQGVLSSHHGVICTEVSHIHCDECGAAENYIGSKLLPVATSDGRMKPSQILPLLSARGVVHHSQPKVVSLTQATECGTVYDSDSVREIAKICHKNDMYLHMDGARISNAAVALGSELGDITGRLGVDILSLGGTKNGAMFGEAIVVWRPELAENLRYIRKQGMQLASKMRFISAQFATLFGTDLWRENAAHANELAQALAARLHDIPGVEIAYPVEANGVFARLPHAAISQIQDEIYFYMWDAEADIVRLMLSFDSTMEDVEALVAIVRKHVS